MSNSEDQNSTNHFSHRNRELKSYRCLHERFKNVLSICNWCRCEMEWRAQRKARHPPLQKNALITLRIPTSKWLDRDAEFSFGSGVSCNFSKNTLLLNNWSRREVQRRVQNARHPRLQKNATIVYSISSSKWIPSPKKIITRTFFHLINCQRDCFLCAHIKESSQTPHDVLNPSREPTHLRHA